LVRFRPGSQEDLAPSGRVARVRANLAALRTLRAIQREGCPASPGEQAVLARWSGWGAVAAVFDPQAANHARFGWPRVELAELLDGQELAAAAAASNTLNAHYTDLGLVRSIWSGLGRLGFRGGRVLEPGCGSGNFIAAAPEGADVVGVEVEPVTAGIAGLLYPQARIRAESFAQTRAPEGSFDLVVGNVPFGQVSLSDRRHNPGGHSIHNHFIIKSLRLTRPGGLVAVLTSRYTMDARNPAARREMAQLADLVTAVRLPSGAHQRAAGTQVVTDLLVLRRREPDREPDPTGWEQVRSTALPGGEAYVNEYFLANPGQVLGRPSVTRGMSSDQDLSATGTPPPRWRPPCTGQPSGHERGLAYTPGQPAGQARPVARAAGQHPRRRAPASRGARRGVGLPACRLPAGGRARRVPPSQAGQQAGRAGPPGPDPALRPRRGGAAAGAPARGGPHAARRDGSLPARRGRRRARLAGPDGRAGRPGQRPQPPAGASRHRPSPATATAVPGGIRPALCWSQRHASGGHRPYRRSGANPRLLRRPAMAPGGGR
jgi:SAM-dependent methyltransferase